MRYAEASGQLSEGGPVRKPAIPNSVLGVIIFIATEVMFFLGLVSAFMITKANALEWPPVDQPRLPVGATAFNTFVLLASGVFMFLAGKTFSKEGRTQTSKNFYLLAVGLGLFFVVFQGFEWARLLGYGLTMQSGTYGAFFYLIIGTHALHAIGAILAQVRLFFKFRKGSLQLSSFRAGEAFWYFVVGVWPILYYLVYLD